jgi:hypothetical protein
MEQCGPCCTRAATRFSGPPIDQVTADQQNLVTVEPTLHRVLDHERP